MSDEKIRKFRALRDISHKRLGETFSIKMGELVTLFSESDSFLQFKEKISKEGISWSYQGDDFEEVFEDEKPKERKFRAKNNIRYILKKFHSGNLYEGEVLTLNKIVADNRIMFNEKIREDGSYYDYCISDFEEITGKVPMSNYWTKAVETMPLHSKVSIDDLSKVSIDDLVKLRSAFSLDEIIVMIEKGII